MNINVHRSEAIFKGQKTYKGRPCRSCSDQEKWVCDSSCVNCKKKNQQRVNKNYWKKLKEEGKNLEHSRASAPARKRYYDSNKQKLKTVMVNKKIKLGEFYIRGALASIKSKCKTRNILFDITVDDIRIPEFCPILGIKLEYNGGRGRKVSKDNSPSIDRVKPELGYSKGNVVVISNKANKLKTNATLAEMKQLVNFYDSV